jgi:hypothetical protein
VRLVEASAYADELLVERVHWELSTKVARSMVRTLETEHLGHVYILLGKRAYDFLVEEPLRTQLSGGMKEQGMNS